jgi:hypothetical protein
MEWTNGVVGAALEQAAADLAEPGRLLWRRGGFAAWQTGPETLTIRGPHGCLEYSLPGVDFAALT